MSLTKEISFLLYKHNCVIVPNFGAFILNEKLAEVNTLTNYASPKNRAVSFNRQINNNDGLLANHIKLSHECSYEEAVSKIESFVSDFKIKLDDQKNLSFDEIGTFYITKEEKLIFVPNHTSNFNMDSFGLHKIKLESQNIIKSSDVITPKVTTIIPHKVYPSSAKNKQVSKSKKVKVQSKKVESKTPIRQSKYNLNLVNILGSFFLVAMIFSLINFELKSSTSNLNQQLASIIDTTPIETVKKFSLEVETPFKIFAEVNNIEEADILTSKLSSKYKKAKTVQGKDSKVKVFIISFSNKELAKEYKQLLQNRMNQKLSLE
jgi:hypothetical protein